jgi:hypothetical protein
MKLCYFLLLFLSACVPVTAPVVPVEQEVIAPLSWEKNRPERAAWSKHLTSKIKSELALFGSAKDLKTICPKSESLSDSQKLQAIAEFFVALAYYESSWNPKSSGVDVGSKDDKGSWSIGLYQISVNDQKWSGGGLKYTYDELTTAEPNIDLAMVLMKRQLERNKLYILPNSAKDRYWAVILDGNRFSKIPQIKQRVIDAAPFCK